MQAPPERASPSMKGPSPTVHACRYRPTSILKAKSSARCSRWYSTFGAADVEPGLCYWPVHETILAAARTSIPTFGYVISNREVTVSLDGLDLPEPEMTTALRLAAKAPVCTLADLERLRGLAHRRRVANAAAEAFRRAIEGDDLGVFGAVIS